jgi:hypothetical protein
MLKRLDFLLIYESIIFYLYTIQVESRHTRVVCEWLRDGGGHA